MLRPPLKRSPIADVVAGELVVDGAGAVLTGGAAASSPPTEKTSIKETITSIVIAFILAFVFRGFVIEAFLIPTGSMAPTLMGAHMRFTGPSTGYTWPVGPHYYSRDDQGMLQGAPLSIQGNRDMPVVVHDPMTGVTSGEELQNYDGVPLRSGDRIFVLKYLYALLGPERFDVIVFKNPTNPQENYIKRLVGLPGEQVALIDGDVFARPAVGHDASEDDRTSESNAWTTDGWTIARKPERVQRAVWQPVFDTRFTPANASKDGRRWFTSPWMSQGPGWQIEDRSVYRYDGANPTSLVWDGAHWPITDRCPYDEIMGFGKQADFYPVSDVRIAAQVEPDAPGSTVSLILDARGHQFRATISGDPSGNGGQVTLEMRAKPAEGEPDDILSWQTLNSGPFRGALKPHQPTSIEFWHADQALTLWINGDQAARAVYDWSPAQRVDAAIGISLAELLKQAESTPRGGVEFNPLADPQRYRQAGVRLELAGGSFTIHRLQLDRDLFYLPGVLHEARTPARATHPYSTPTLTSEQFFVCGDNSPSSLDARLWERVDPWVQNSITDGAIGVVPRELLVGKAFFVYFPSLQRSLGLPVPDFGRMRWIW